MIQKVVPGTEWTDKALDEKQRVRDEEEKRLFGPYPATNRHERRKAAKLMRQKAKQ